MVVVTEIYIEGYHPELVKKAKFALLFSLKKLAKKERLGAACTLQSSLVKTTKSQVGVIRGPFTFKKSGDNYRTVVFKSKLTLNLNLSNRRLGKFLFLLKRIEASVFFGVRVKYRHKLRPLKNAK